MPNAGLRSQGSVVHHDQTPRQPRLRTAIRVHSRLREPTETRAAQQPGVEVPNVLWISSVSGQIPDVPSVAVCATQTAAEARIVHDGRSEEHTAELQSREKLVCRLLHEKKK